MLRNESFKRGILYSSALNIVAKVFGYLQTIAISYYFGAQSQTDIFFFCYSIVLMVVGFITMMNSAAIIPEGMRRKEKEGETSAQNFFNFFLILYPVIGLVITFFGLLFPVDILTFISQFDSNILYSESTLIRSLMVLFVLNITVQFLIDILISYRFFTIPYVANIITNILTLITIVLFHDVLGIIGISVAIMVSYIIQIIVIAFIMVRVLSWKFKFSQVNLSLEVVKNIGFAQAGNIFSILGGFAPYYFLSGVGTGIITSLNYGLRIFDIPGTMFVNQFSYITGVKLNELYAKKDFDQISKIFVTTTKFLFYVLTPIATIFFLKSDNIIIIMYGRGAFSLESTLLSASFLRYLSLTLPFLGVFTIGARLFMAGQIQKNVFWIQATSNIILIFLIDQCIKIGGPEKYPIALFVISILNIIATGWLIYKYFGYINFFDVLIYGGKILLINIVLGLLLIFATSYFSLKSSIDLFLFVIIFLTLHFIINIRGRINQDVSEIMIKLFIKIRQSVSMR